MIRPDAAQRRRLKHERYLREIREKNDLLQLRFLIDRALDVAGGSA